jgi:hypothetical protein
MCRRVICRAATDVLAASLGRPPRLANAALNFHRAANALLKLHSEAGGYNGVVLTLYAVRGGNLETLPISAEDFLGGEDTP